LLDSNTGCDQRSAPPHENAMSCDSTFSFVTKQRVLLIASGGTRGLNQGEKLSSKGTTQKKTWEMMVNPVVDGCT